MTITFPRVASAIAIACATLSAPAALAQEPAAEASDAAAAAALHALFERSEAAMLDRNPVTAFFRGDFSDADRMGDYSPASYAADRAAAQANLAELATIDRAALGETDRIAYDVFEYTQQRTLAQTAPDVLPTVLALPIDHFRGLHVFYPRFSAPGALMPYDTVQDYENNFSRHRAMAEIIDQAIQMHGAAGVSQWTPLAGMYTQQRTLRLADGPDEVHHMVVGRAEIRKYQGGEEDASLASVWRK